MKTNRNLSLVAMGILLLLSPDKSKQVSRTYFKVSLIQSQYTSFGFTLNKLSERCFGKISDVQQHCKSYFYTFFWKLKFTPDDSELVPNEELTSAMTASLCYKVCEIVVPQLQKSEIDVRRTLKKPNRQTFNGFKTPQTQTSSYCVTSVCQISRALE